MEVSSSESESSLQQITIICDVHVKPHDLTKFEDASADNPTTLVEPSTSRDVTRESRGVISWLPRGNYECPVKKNGGGTKMNKNEDLWDGFSMNLLDVDDISVTIHSPQTPSPTRDSPCNAMPSNSLRVQEKRQKCNLTAKRCILFWFFYTFAFVLGPDLPYGFLGFSPGPRGFQGPPAKSKRICISTDYPMTNACSKLYLRNSHGVQNLPTSSPHICQSNHCAYTVLQNTQIISYQEQIHAHSLRCALARLESQSTHDLDLQTIAALFKELFKRNSESTTLMIPSRAIVNYFSSPQTYTVGTLILYSRTYRCRPRALPSGTTVKPTGLAYQTCTFRPQIRGQLAPPLSPATT
ncbi:hypothetical protein EVAR_73373_1 [Eumeta japonica]|uniref:Uncharacterized protein n=1 Tax=Eumeta variegata TaxID=151549 RepID=A0A4C1T447_EUMVA|nr:hypothetical protein EVAR_73373_1 [Eumeta japonica]